MQAAVQFLRAFENVAVVCNDAGAKSMSKPQYVIGN